MNTNIFLIGFFSVFFISIHGIEYRQAQQSDIAGILDLINFSACNDSDKIVIVPKLFRRGYVESGVQEGRFFVATQQGRIIGYKKLFCITDSAEQNDILSNELRCNTQAIAAASIRMSGDLAENRLFVFQSDPTVTCVYTGADFTHPDYRSMGVNAGLMGYAFSSISNNVVRYMEDKKSKRLMLVYGLTQMNGGDANNLLGGRSRGIFREYVSFVRNIADKLQLAASEYLLLTRHIAFKPTFNPDSIECCPLPDTQSVPGYGCTMQILFSDRGQQ